jgi:hypothetical protein
MGHTVDKDSARATLRAVTPDLRSGQTKFVPERHCQRFLRHDVDPTLLTINSQRHKSLNGSRGLCQSNTLTAS